MADTQPYRIELAPQITRHLSFIDIKLHAVVRRAIDEQLRHQPGVPTRNRKPLRVEIHGASWEIRCGPRNTLRIFYNIDEVARLVMVAAVGVKLGSQLFVAGEEVEK